MEDDNILESAIKSASEYLEKAVGDARNLGDPSKIFRRIDRLYTKAMSIAHDYLLQHANQEIMNYYKNNVIPKLIESRKRLKQELFKEYVQRAHKSN